jgi:hypothetical protein
MGSSFKSLSLLPNLNLLTNAPFDESNVGCPAPSYVRARVYLSGGDLRGVQSSKPLKFAFFEFFGREGTVTIQPAIEDVLYTAAEGTVNLGFAATDGRGARESLALTAAGGDGPLVGIMSLPRMLEAPPTIRTSSLQHFSLYYLLTPEAARRPLVRVVARAEEYVERQLNKWRIVHTMPPFAVRSGADAPPPSRQRVGRPRKGVGGQERPHNFHYKFTTPENCHCLASQAFIPTTRQRAPHGKPRKRATSGRRR